MKSGGRALALLLFFSFSASGVMAQLSADDSIFYQKAVNNTVAVYYQSTGDQSGLYNGSQYAGYPFAFKDAAHPFFFTNLFTTGSVVYDNILYTDAQLLYDEAGDVLIFRDTSHRLQLISDRISRFTIWGNNFIRIEKDSTARDIINTGFYNLLYQGEDIQVIKKEVKNIREDIRNNYDGVIRYIEVKKYYYIKKNNTFYPVKNKKVVIEIFKDRKKEIQQYIKVNRLSFKNDRDNMLIKATAYYEQVTK
jgi:hypothetical protein